MKYIFIIDTSDKHDHEIFKIAAIIDHSDIALIQVEDGFQIIKGEDLGTIVRKENIGRIKI